VYNILKNNINYLKSENNILLCINIICAFVSINNKIHSIKNVAKFFFVKHKNKQILTLPTMHLVTYLINPINPNKR